MELLDIFDPPNWLPVIVSTVVYFGLGAVWYNPKVFGTAWMGESGVDPNDEAAKARMPMVMGVTVVLILLSMLVLAHLVPPGGEIAKVLQWVLVLGIAFVLPISGMNALYEGKSPKFFLVNYGYHQIGIAIGAVIFALWK